MSLRTPPLPNPSRRQLLGAATAAALSSGWPVAAQAHNPRTLKVVSPWEVMTLEPSKMGYIFTRLEVAETLVDVDDTGHLVGGLARSWSVSPDGLQWRFTLRPTARFHNNTPVTAAAVVAGLQRAWAQPGVLRSTGVQRIMEQGGGVVFKLAKPFSALPAFLAHSSTLILAPASFGADGSVKQLIGSGPYQVVAVNAPQSMRTRRFEGFDGRKPVIEAVDYLGAGRGETRGMMAASGQADLVYTLDPVSYARLRSNRQLTLQLQAIPRTIYVKVNAGHRFLSDVRVRRALSLALDRKGIATALLRAPDAVATQLFPPSMPGWHVPGLPPLAQNIEQARALLREVGWQASADGLLRNKAGEPFKLTLRTFPDRPELPPMATAIQAQLKAVGIAVAVNIGNSSEIPSSHQDGTLELALVARNYSLVPDPLGTLLQDFGPKGGDWGAMGWHNTRVSQAIAALSLTVNSQRQGAERSAIATLLQAELPVIPVVWYQHSMTASTRLTHVSVDPLERSYRISRMGWVA